MTTAFHVMLYNRFIGIKSNFRRKEFQRMNPGCNFLWGRFSTGDSIRTLNQFATPLVWPAMGILKLNQAALKAKIKLSIKIKMIEIKSFQVYLPIMFWLHPYTSIPPLVLTVLRTANNQSLKILGLTKNLFVKVSKVDKERGIFMKVLKDILQSI